MKIERMILGQRIEIELTDGELYRAYYEQQCKFDVENCRNEFELRFADEPWFSNVFHNEDVMDTILQDAACIMRKCLDECNTSYNVAADEAFNDPWILELIERAKGEAK